MKRILALACALLLAPCVALAQQDYPSVIIGSQQVSATTTTSTPAALPSAADAIYHTITFYNEGTHDGWCAIGGSGVTATTSSPDLVPAGKAVRVAVAGGAFVACITATSTATIDVYQSNGPVDLQ